MVAKSNSLQRLKIPAGKFAAAKPSKPPLGDKKPPTPASPPPRGNVTKVDAKSAKGQAGTQGGKSPGPGKAEYGDMKKKPLDKVAAKGTPEQAKKIAGAMRGRAMP